MRNRARPCAHLRIGRFRKGAVARDFFKARLGDILGALNIPPASLFYVIYGVGIVIFANGADGATWRTAPAESARCGAGQ
ncbi:MAG: DUF2177 family protein [Proteobacteria bacterium]|nr:DUF2177 family protein [Pseudomonadota bacterium]